MEAENEDPPSKLMAHVNSIDAEIEENANYSSCISHEIENFKLETERLKAETAEKQTQIKNLESQLAELSKCLSTQQATLTSSERSALNTRTLVENLTREADEMNKKNEELLALYNDELKDYRSIYMNASTSYKEFRVQEIELKKLKVKALVLTSNLDDMKKSRRDFMKIQWKRLQNRVHQLAEINILHEANQKEFLSVKELKKEEKQLVEEYRLATEAVKQKQKLQRIEQNKTKLLKTSEKQNSSLSDIQNFLKQESRPINLTEWTPPQKLENFNHDKSKVTILDAQILKLAQPKLKINLKQRMEEIVRLSQSETNRASLLESNSGKIAASSCQKNATGSQKSSKSEVADEIVSILKPPNRESQSTNLTEGTAPQTLADLNDDNLKAKILDVQNSKPVQPKPNINLKQRMEEIVRLSQLETKRGSFMETSLGSNSSKVGASFSQKNGAGSQKSGTPAGKSEITGEIGLIHKSPNQTIDDGKHADMEENVSKFFSVKKKSVTFQTDRTKELSPDVTYCSAFLEKQMSVPRAPIDTNIFQKSFFDFNHLSRSGQNVNIFDKSTEIPTGITSEGEMGTGTSMVDTDMTGTTSIGGTNYKKGNEFNFDGRPSSPFNYSFDIAFAPENTNEMNDDVTFNFSNRNNNNPFSFFGNN